MTQTTIVFDINLPDDEESHEWSYLELVQEHLAKNTDESSKCDPFEEADRREDKRLAELAKSLEKKYGTMVTMQKSGSRKRVRIDDFLDPGDGYDSQDSFIDDSEAVDVYVAPNVSTKLGGFFVHEGVVEGLEDQNARIEAPVGSWQKPNPIARPVKKDKSKELLEKAVKRLSTPKLSPNVSRAKMQNLDSVFDAVLSTNKVPSTARVSPPATPIKMENSTQIDVKPNVPKSTALNSSETTQLPSLPSLPPSLPTEVVSRIEALVKLASPNGTQQVRILSKPFNNELLNLAGALSASKVNPSTRSAIFGYMEAKLQWKRKSIARRLKKLSEANEDQKMNPLLDALGDAISRTMPALLEAYAKDKELHAERVKIWQQENRNNETETNEHQSNGGPTEGSAVKRNPKPGAPKKIFRWNNESRSLFHSIVTRRLESYQLLNIKGPKEEYLKALFPTLIQLWPEGWITNAALWRAALPVFQRFSAENPSGSQATTTPKTVAPVTASPQSTSGSSAPEMSPKVFDPASKSVSILTSTKAKSSTSIIRQSPIPNADPMFCAPKPTCIESVTSCTVTLQPLTTTTQHESKSQTTSRHSNTIQSLPPASHKPMASSSVNLQQAIRSMVESKASRTIVTGEPTTPLSHSESRSTLPGGSPPCIQSLVQLKASPTALTTGAVASPSRPSFTKPSSIVQPVGSSVSRTTLTQLSTALTQTNRATTATATTTIHSSLIRSTDPIQLPSNTCVTTTSSNGPSTGTPISLNRDVSRSAGSGAAENPVRVTTVRCQAAPIIINRGPKPTQALISNTATPLIQRTDSQHSPSAGAAIPSAYEKQARQQLLYQSAAVALSASQIDQLQQRAVSTSARPTTSVNSCNPWLAATALLLQRPQPPPAHQQPPITTSYHMQREPDAVSSTSAAHSGNQITKGVPSPSTRTLNPTFAHPGAGPQS